MKHGKLTIPGRLTGETGVAVPASRAAQDSRAELHTTRTRVAIELRSTGAGDLVVLRRDATGGKTEVLFRVSIGDEAGSRPRAVEISFGPGVSALVRSPSPGESK
jgi:hypothetical protein